MVIISYFYSGLFCFENDEAEAAGFVGLSVKHYLSCHDFAVSFEICTEFRYEGGEGRGDSLEKTVYPFLPQC